MSARMINYRRFALAPVAFAIVAGLGTFFVGATAHATLVGNDPTPPWQFESDGDQVLDFQSNHPFSQVGTVNSFTFYRGTTTPATPLDFAALIVRPTGNINEYTVIFDSGTLDMTTFAAGVHVVNISSVGVQVGDLVASWGRGIGFSFGDGSGTNFTNGPTGIPKPSGTFLAPSLPDYPALNQDRKYALAFNFTPVPEPSSVALTIAALFGFSWVRGRRR